MSIIATETQHIRDLLHTIIGETRAKTVFSYYGIFKDNILIGLYKQKKFYLRVSRHAVQHTEWLKEMETLNDPTMGIHYKHCYHIPNDILADTIRYAHLIPEAIQELTATKKQGYLSRKKLIRTLPNLNINIERILKRLGITSSDDLLQKGELNTFVELIKMGVEADQNLLFKLYGAVHHQYIYTMTAKQKLALLKEANQALYNAGLRKRFKINE